MVSTSEGGILWANMATEKLLGYSAAELVPPDGSEGLNWEELTVDQHDLEADRQMVQRLEEGSREEYALQKSYRHKNGQPVNCQIHVLRWPRMGDVQFYLVTILPLEGATEYVVKELVSMRKAIVSMEENQNRMTFGRFLGLAWQWFDKNRVFGCGLGLFFLSLIGGNRTIEIAKAIVDAILERI